MHYVLLVVACLLCCTVFISLVKNTYWVFKMMEYPRYQKLILFSILLGFWIVLYRQYTGFPLIVFCISLLCWAFLLYKVWPYTPLFKKEVLTVKPGNTGNTLSIFAANVLMENTRYETMLQQARDSNADIVYLMETDDKWQQTMQALKETHPYCVEEPLPNTYGLLFYSKYKLHDARVKYLVKDDVPSVDVVVELPSGKRIQLWGLHPEPPVPGESLTSTAKDKELMKIGLAAKDHPLPVIVVGDLNDVAWSHTTRIFRSTSKLLDPRRGRGFYSTFSAHHWFIKYPLDYIFCSSDFGLVSMKRLPKNGSDHFATLTTLELIPQLEKEQEKEEPSDGELKEAEEMATRPLDAND